MRWAALGADGGTWLLHGARDAEAAVPTDGALLAREVASLLVEADDALLRGDLAIARDQYVEALSERAPRHAEIAARIVQIDARMPARAEAALATLVESAESSGGGLVAGELLAQVGDVEGGRSRRSERAGENELRPPRSPRARSSWQRALPRDPEAAARRLDRALARSPRSTQARWARVGARLALGRLEDALADVEHLEALARGARGKYAVWLRAGRAWEAATLGSHTGAIFERALRYAPEEPTALVGLGVALVGEGREARGVSLLDRALEIARSRAEPGVSPSCSSSRAPSPSASTICRPRSRMCRPSRRRPSKP